MSRGEWLHRTPTPFKYGGEAISDPFFVHFSNKIKLFKLYRASNHAHNMIVLCIYYIILLYIYSCLSTKKKKVRLLSFKTNELLDQSNASVTFCASLKVD